MLVSSIVLGVRRSSKGAAASRQAKSGVTTAEWPSLRDSVLKRDKFTCAYCGFTAKKFQRVHFKNGEPAPLALENLTTACIFCEQCFELESVGKMHSGTLIWLPDISQTDLHHLCRALYVARLHDGHALSKNAQHVLDQLLARRVEAKKRIGTDDPVVLATALFEQMDDTAYAARAPKLEGIRLFPLSRRLGSGSGGEKDHFPDIIQYWTSPDGPFADGTPEKMIALAEKLVA